MIYEWWQGAVDAAATRGLERSLEGSELQVQQEGLRSDVPASDLQMIGALGASAKKRRTARLVSGESSTKTRRASIGSFRRTNRSFSTSILIHRSAVVSGTAEPMQRLVTATRRQVSS